MITETFKAIAIATTDGLARSHHQGRFSPRTAPDFLSSASTKSILRNLAAEDVAFGDLSREMTLEVAESEGAKDGAHLFNTIFLPFLFQFNGQLPHHVMDEAVKQAKHVIAAAEERGLKRGFPADLMFAYSAKAIEKILSLSETAIEEIQK